MKTYNKSDINLIIEKIKENELFVLKTDTVYGIMAIATKENEEKINLLKNSPIDKKISVIFPDKKTLFSYIKDLTKEKKQLIDEKLPGKYTFIVNLENFSNFNRYDFGVRITEYDFLQNIIKIVGPLLATSCNLSKQDVCNNIADITTVFKDKNINVVKDDDAINKPSTIIDITNDIKIIRN